MLKIYNDPNSNTNLMAHTRLDSNQIVSTAFCNCRYNIVDRTKAFDRPLKPLTELNMLDYLHYCANEHFALLYCASL